MFLITVCRNDRFQPDAACLFTVLQLIFRGNPDARSRAELPFPAGAGTIDCDSEFSVLFFDERHRSEVARKSLERFCRRVERGNVYFILVVAKEILSLISGKFHRKFHYKIERGFILFPTIIFVLSLSCPVDYVRKIDDDVFFGGIFAGGVVENFTITPVKNGSSLGIASLSFLTVIDIPSLSRICFA